MSLEYPRNSDRFENLINQGITLLDFSASWCKPCLEQTQILEKIESKFHQQMTIKYVDIDQNRNLALNIGIQSIPTLILFKDGHEQQRWVGLQSENTLREDLEWLLNKK